MARSNRLDLIVDMLETHQTLLDVGCDHGLAIKKAFDLEKIKYAIAADIHVEPLKAAKINLIGYAVKFVLSNGFKNIHDPFDAVVIAGMGTYTMIEILKDAPINEDILYVLQSNDKHHLLRKYLSENNFMIIDEKIVFDGFYYIVMKVRRGSMSLLPDELYLGKYLLRQDLGITYFKSRLQYYETLIKENKMVSNEIMDAYHAIKRGVEKNKGERVKQ